MATLASLNTVRTNGLSLVEQFGTIEHKPESGEALNTVRNAAIVNIASALESAENATVPNVMAWGASRAVLQFALNYDAAKLDKADKLAIGAKDLPAASPAKRRLSHYHSRFRRIAEEWETIPQGERDELLAGTRSFLSVYDGIVKREKAAEKAKADAAAAAAAEAAIAEAKAEGKAEGEASAKPSGLLDALEAAIAAYPLADATERELAGDLLAALADMFNSDPMLGDIPNDTEAMSESDITLSNAA